MEELVPAGFRFYPTEEELICFYLHHKLEGSRPNLDQVIPVVDIYTHEPWDLPMVAGERGSWRGENEEQWFFFTAQQEREARGGKPNRTTASGYWKATGSPGYVFSTTHKRAVGVKKTMVFYKGRAPLGKKTPWKMNEYKAIDFGSPQINLDASSSHHAPPIPKLRHEMSVCRVYITSGSSRAFDRRPSAASTTALPPPHHHLQLAADAATDDHHHHQLTTTTTATTATNAVVVEKSSSSSTDSSKSRGGDQKADQQEISNTTTNTHNIMDHEMITSGLQPLWEWEQLNWP